MLYIKVTKERASRKNDPVGKEELKYKSTDRTKLDRNPEKTRHVLTVSWQVVAKDTTVANLTREKKVLLIIIEIIKNV